MESTGTAKNISELKLKNKFLNSSSFEEMINLIGLNLNKNSSSILAEIFSENFQISSENLTNEISITSEEPEKSIFYFLLNSSNFGEKKIHLTNFVLAFFSTLTNSNTQIIHKILAKPEYLKEIFEIISLFTNLKEKQILNMSQDTKLSAIQIFLDCGLNFKFWKPFLDIFELIEILFKEDGNSSNGLSLITNHINISIDQLIKEKSKKFENLLKMIEFTKEYSDSVKINSVIGQINSKLLFDYFLSDRNLFSFLKKLLKIFPFEIENVINFFLSINETKSINSLLKDFDIDEINPKIKEDIIFKSQCKATKYHYHRYYNYEIDFQQLIELTDKNKLVLVFLLELCCRDKLFVESYHVLKFLDFNVNELEIEENSLKNLYDYLVELTNCKDYSKLEKKNEKIIGTNKSGIKGKNKYPGNFEIYENKNSHQKFTDVKNSLQNGFVCKFKTSSRISQEFLKSLSKHEKLQIESHDFFGPYEYNCMKLPLKSKDIWFIDNTDKLKKIKNLQLIDNNYPYLGFDSEWKSANSPFDVDNGASIIQLATKNKVFILDVIRLSSMPVDELNEFNQILSQIIGEKIIIGFNHKNDLNNIKNSLLKKCFSGFKSIDFNDVYENKFKIKCPSLKKVCLELLNKDLCKYEQISNWENRPLRLRQLHYAALDAYILLILFEKI